MFKILQNLHFYSNAHIRKKLKEIHNIVTRGLGRYIEYGKQKRSAILVSYADSLSKSGAYMANLYADEAQIYTENIVEKGRLVDKLNEKTDIKAIVFIDDFVGTGNQIIENLDAMLKNLGPVVLEKKIKVVFIAIVAISEGWNNVQDALNKIGIQIESHFCELLNDSDRIFGEQSYVLPDASMISLCYGSSRFPVGEDMRRGMPTLRVFPFSTGVMWYRSLIHIMSFRPRRKNGSTLSAHLLSAMCT